ncbi:MAG: hypothetical protein NZ483_07855, partial [Verrucomicrobiae bacterium]|nr:hypothetical protein [Verrucomicrobiae bacterium]
MIASDQRVPVKCPLLGLAVAYAAGIGMASVLPGSLELWAGIGTVSAVAAYLVRRWRVLVWPVVLVAGGVSYHGAVRVSEPHHVVRL